MKSTGCEQSSSSCAGRTPDTSQMTEIIGNFNTWNLAISFKEVDRHYQQAVMIALYAELLYRSPWATGIYVTQLIEHAYLLSTILWDNPKVVTFASPISWASRIRAFGQESLKSSKQHIP